MSTVFEAAVAAIAQTLSGAGVANVKRFRSTALEPPAVILRPLSMVVDKDIGQHLEGLLAVEIAVLAQASASDPADKVADATVADVHAALLADIRLGLAAVMFITLESINWDFDDVESVAVRLVYQVTLRASAYDLEVAG
jgi:hypothetical protein